MQEKQIKLTVSPSRLYYVDKCPRFNPTPFQTKDAEEGVNLHEIMEDLVARPVAEWDSIVASIDDPSSRNAVALCAGRIRDYMDMGLTVIPGGTADTCDGRNGINPGIYPEFRIRHYSGVAILDLLAVMPGGETASIIDYKFVRNGIDPELQLTAYALLVREASGGRVTDILAGVLAPYLVDPPEDIRFDSPEKFAEAERRIAGIIGERENRWSPAVCGPHCSRCAYNGSCPAQAQTVAALEPVKSDVSLDLTTLSDSEDAITPERRGLRRIVANFLSDMADRIKERDKAWLLANEGSTLPHFKTVWCKGRSSVDKTRSGEIFDALRLKYGWDDATLLSLSSLDKEQAVSYLALTAGIPKTVAEKEIGAALLPFMKEGAAYPRLSPLPGGKRLAGSN